MILMTGLFVLTLLVTDPALAGAPGSSVEPTGGGVLEGHARRGLTLDRLDGLAGESARACAAVCAGRPACQAWTWRMGWTGRAPRCDLHGAAATPFPHPGAVTGLSESLAARIDAAAERAPSARERAALMEADGVLSAPRRSRDELEGG